MRKAIVLSVVLVASVIVMNAQPRAIGARLGFGVEASYQHSLGEKNMLQLDAGIPCFNSFQVVGTYNWIFPISSWKHSGSWNLYAGVGAGAGLGWWYGKRLILDYDGARYASRFYGIVGGVGMFGAEYNFKFPLQVFADVRPLIGVGTSKHDVWFHTEGLWSFAIGARYRF